MLTNEDRDISLIMLVNFIRSEVHRFQEENGGEVTSNFVLDLQQRICANPVQEFLTEERYMRPFSLMVIMMKICLQIRCYIS